MILTSFHKIQKLNEILRLKGNKTYFFIADSINKCECVTKEKSSRKDIKIISLVNSLTFPFVF